jgi:hypothetical protein
VLRGKSSSSPNEKYQRFHISLYDTNITYYDTNIASCNSNRALYDTNCASYDPNIASDDPNMAWHDTTGPTLSGGLLGWVIHLVGVRILLSKNSSASLLLWTFS